MNYETAYNRLEEVVTRMQKDLQAYAESENASQRAVDTRTNIINTIVEYATQANELVAATREALVAEQMKYSRLHADTTKLVVFTELHRINPNMIFHYKLEELKKMKAEGVCFIPPVKDLGRMVFHQEDAGIYYTDPKEEIDHWVNLAAYQEKYNSLKQFLNH